MSKFRHVLIVGSEQFPLFRHGHGESIIIPKRVVVLIRKLLRYSETSPYLIQTDEEAVMQAIAQLAREGDTRCIYIAGVLAAWRMGV